MNSKEESGTPLSRVEEIEMVRCFNVSTTAGVEYLVQFIPPFDQQYFKVTYPYLGGEVDEPIRTMVKKAVLEYIEADAR